MRVVIAEDSFLLREGLVRLLEIGGITVLDALGDTAGLFESVSRNRPDLAILDVRMPPTFKDEGLRAALELRKQRPEMAVLILSQYVEEEYATELLRGDTNGVGYLLKDRVADMDEFLDAVRRIAGAAPSSTPRWSRSCWSGTASRWNS